MLPILRVNCLRKALVSGAGTYFEAALSTCVLAAFFAVKIVAALMHCYFFLVNDPVSGGDQIHTIRWCEWTIQALVVILICLVITSKAFEEKKPLQEAKKPLQEAEKLALEISTARKVYAKANKFARHEVKNGLLAAIGLCDGLLEMSAKSLKRCRSRTKSTGETLLEPFSRVSGPRSLSLSGGNDELGMAAWLSELDATLTSTLNTVLLEAMARDLVYDIYETKVEVVEVESLLRSSTPKTATNFLFEALSRPFPAILIDPQLLMCFYRHAISNATKYGARGANIVTRLFYDGAEITLQVLNEPGNNQDALMALSEEEIKETIFNYKSPLHAGSLDEAASIKSTGDGGWIMQRCAHSLGGKVGIIFGSDATAVTLSCPAAPCPTLSSNASLEEDDEVCLEKSEPLEWQLPPGVWGIGIDDSAMQRKLLRKIFQYCGVSDDHIIITGATAEECCEFTSVVEKHIRSHPGEKFLVIADEHLDFNDGTSLNGKRATFSGSMAILSLRDSLRVKSLGALDVPETQVLALVRSANDGADEIARYHERAHGFIAKAPLRKEKVRETLAPIWSQRFGRSAQLEANTNDRMPFFDLVSPKSPDGPPPSLRSSHKNGFNDDDNDGAKLGDNETTVIPARSQPRWCRRSIDNTLEEIDDLASQLHEKLCEKKFGVELSKESPQSPQRESDGMSDALHRLKGDLMCLSDGRAVRAAIRQTESVLPDTAQADQDVEMKWAKVRAFIGTLTFDSQAPAFFQSASNARLMRRLLSTPATTASFLSDCPVSPRSANRNFDKGASITM